LYSKQVYSKALKKETMAIFEPKYNCKYHFSSIRRK